ncbi:hypothetical protein ACFFMN_08030 [Planobispora siamensis]|uniref:Transcriptional regulator n=1 Tax=Planobispora siamensis TaxID=936338 RepID=A0A8J3WIC8_9ACTN|nr:hypothetical protein [Planobispora siamensis]GIH90438.1 hypothetical protein Psi01_10680 [Planobispora siamensis]
MGAAKGRISRIGQGKVFTVDAIARHVAALGGKLNLVAEFGDHTHKVGGAEELKAS